MFKTTQKNIRSYLLINGSVNCTFHSTSDYQKVIEKELFLEKVAYSSGTYGCNGILLKGYNSGKYYVVPCRCSALFIYN